MRIHYECGECDSTFEVEDSKNVLSPEAVWLMANRFANAHATHGFVTNGVSDPVSTTTKIAIASILGDD